ncbi:MAG: sodium:solute symporter family protein [Oscillospiraceae bacterium]|jgi:SSS family solute:Na+ symporter|nr:sodium:solute symporter family protein [Oscillospiraceae bacterium]
MGYIVAICIYLFALIVYGLIVARKKVKTTDDMIVGGHKIPFIILVGSLLATWCGGGGITGSAGIIFTGGPIVGLIAFSAAPIGIFLLYFIAGRMRKSNKVTVPSVMRARYGKTAGILSALCIMIAYIGVVATQLKAAANVIVLLCTESGIQVSYSTALIACAAVIVIVTVGGGLVSVAYSDAISALIMLGGFAIAIPFLVMAADKAGAVMPAAKASFTGGLSFTTLLGYFVPTIALVLGDQNMMQRFASAKDSKSAKKSNLGMLIGELVVIVLTVAFVAQACRLYDHLDKPANVIFQETIDYLPFLSGAIMICACMAFIVTTADSFLLSAATNLSNDIFAEYIKKDATDKQKMLVLRVTIVVFTIIAVLLTACFPTVLALQLTAYTMYGAAITPAILFALFSKKVTPAAGVAGIIAGGAATILWTVLGTPGGLQCAIVSVPVSILAILVVTAVTKNRSSDHTIDSLYQG